MLTTSGGQDHEQDGIGDGQVEQTPDARNRDGGQGHDLVDQELFHGLDVGHRSKV